MADNNSSTLEAAKSRLLSIPGGIRDFVNLQKNRFIVEPEDVGRAAELEAAKRYGGVGEWTKADAAKHMAWQAALARNTGLPDRPARLVANTIGLGKEVLVDGIGSAAIYLKDAIQNGKFNPELSPVDTWKNSFMDTRNNAVGASRLKDSKDIVNDAVELAGKATSSVSEGVKNNLPYANK